MNLQLQPRRRRRTAGRVLVFTDAKELMEFKKTSRLIRTVRQLLKKYSADKINCMVTDKKRFTVAAPKNTHNDPMIQQPQRRNRLLQNASSIRAFSQSIMVCVRVCVCVQTGMF